MYCCQDHLCHCRQTTLFYFIRLEHPVEIHMYTIQHACLFSDAISFSSDTEDYIWENNAEYPLGGSELHLQDTGNAIGEDDVTPSTESTDTPSPSPLKESDPTQLGPISTEEVYNNDATSFEQLVYPRGRFEKIIEDAGKDMVNSALEPLTEKNGKRDDLPFEQIVRPDNGSMKNDGDTTNNVSRSDTKTLKEHIFTRIFPPILPMVHPKDAFHLKANESSSNTWQGEGGTSKNYAAMDAQHTLSVHSDSQYGNGVSGTWESKAKPFMANMQKKILPPLRPTVYKNVLNSSFLNDEDIQILDSHGKLDSFAGVDVNIPQYNMKDNMDANNNGFYKSAEHRRHLPPWMSVGSAAGQLAVSSSHSSLSTYPKSSGNHLGMGEKTIDEDERLIFQAALQDLSQPKYEGDLPADLLSISLMRHQGLGKTISIIALIQMERPHQVEFSSGVSGYIKSDALNLDEADNALPEDKKSKCSEEYLRGGPQKSTLSSDHSCGPTSKLQDFVEIDDENRELVTDFEEHSKTQGIKYEISCSVKPDSSFPEIKKADDSGECNSSNKDSAKCTTYKGRPAGGTLVVCPASILRQWAHEIEEKVPENPSYLAKYDVVLTTYSIVSNEVPKQRVDDDGEQRTTENYALSSEFSLKKKKKRTSDEERGGKGKRKRACDSGFDHDSGPLARVRWFRVVLDEAQTIKNFRTQVSKACCGLRAKRRWCLSGTPLQNSLDDLYGYFRFLKYDPYAVYSSFCSSIKNPIATNPTAGYKKLQAILRTIMLRRTKGTLIDGEAIIKLPPKLINLKKIYFSPEEREFYSSLEADSRQKFKAFAAAGTVNQNYASILLLLLRLRQACDHPLLVKEHHSCPAAKSSSKMAQRLPREVLIYLLNRLEASLAICGVCSDPPEEAVVTMCGHVFCYQSGCKDIIGADSVFSGSTLRNCLSGESVEGSSGVADRPEGTFHSSCKIDAAMDILRSICKIQCPEPAGEQHYESVPPREDHTKASESEPPVKAIVFSQRLDGSMSLASRERAVKDFNTDPEVSVMIMSLKAGNLGLNMVAACHVILLDPWWNPTTEDQAIDRAHRIGQVRPVTVSRLTVCDTVEDRILALQEKKREMVSSAFGEDQTVVARLASPSKTYNTSSGFRLRQTVHNSVPPPFLPFLWREVNGTPILLYLIY
ncbi:unnamed protein product [Spirodela intermedia]|uniref:Uncharacterized protein n=1 Tax=Spirodela intermedia TaxID=51605 RepID=A0A7I8JUV0_SPIIN|nr:unnamed protein product [Spirodela intermedia]CAA6673393.1 unnamed protein product [Spirodela intermedia]